MPLEQDVSIEIVSETISGQTLGASLRIENGLVTLNYLISPRARIIAQDTAEVGSGAATTLLSYFDTATGLLTESGETHAQTVAYNGATIGDYFS